MELNLAISLIILLPTLSALLCWSLANRRLARLTEELGVGKQSLVQLNAQVSGLQTTLQDHDQKLTVERQTHHDTKLALATANQQALSLNERLGTLEQREQLSNQKLEQQQSENKALTAQLSALRAEQKERDASHLDKIKQFDAQKLELKQEFENLSNRIFEEKGKSFVQTSKSSLDALLQPFKEQIEGFQKRINDIHTESVKGNTSLESEIKKVLEVGLKMHMDATNLTSALKGDSQQRGAWGEAQLERTLQMSGLIAHDHYSSQDTFKDEEGRSKRTDYVIHLPDGKNIIIDSKVNLPDYDRAIAAATDDEANIALKAHVVAVRKHIDELAAKNYTALTGLNSPSFVLMFMPIEPAYIEALKFDKELFNYGYQKGIVLVSHTTLIPILRTVSNLWMLEQSNREAKELGDKALEIYNSVCTVSERMNKLGNSLRAVGNHYNDTVTSLIGQQGLIGKVERFGLLSSKAKKTMDKLEPLQIGGDDRRLILEAKPLAELPAAADTSCEVPLTN